MSMNPIYALAIAGVLVAVGDVSLAHWARSSATAFMALGLLLNICGILVYSGTLASEHIGLATGIFLGLNILLVTLAGSFIFNDSLTLARYAGIGLISLGIVAIEVL